MDSRNTHPRQHQQQQNQSGQIKRATKILADNNPEQDQYISKQGHPSDNNNDSNSLGCNPDTIGITNASVQPINNLDLQPMDSIDVANLPSSSFNIRPCSFDENPVSNISIGITASATVVPATTTTTNSQNVMTLKQTSNLSEQQFQQQPQHPFKQSTTIPPYDIKSLFECPICFDYAVPPIYQCQNGHLVCQSCSGKITNCPTCRVNISEPSIRNLQLDRLASNFQFPCKYNFNGCQWKSYWFKKREHEENCDYVSYSCPCPGSSCKWTGLLPQVMPHLSEHHKSITTLNGEDIVFLATDINLKGAVDWVMIQSCFNHHFLLVLEKQEMKSGQQQFFAIVQLIGSQKEASKFRFRLELNSCTPNGVRRLQWEATPRSIQDGIQSAIAKFDCLVFDSRMARHFLSPIKRDAKSEQETNTDSNQGENLGINVTIEQAL